jgi:hypothetical protein
MFGLQLYVPLEHQILSMIKRGSTEAVGKRSSSRSPQRTIWSRT